MVKIPTQSNLEAITNNSNGLWKTTSYKNDIDRVMKSFQDEMK